MEKGYLRWLEEKKLKDILKLRGHAKILVLFLMKRLNDGVGLKFSLDYILDLLGLKEKYSKLPKFRFNFYVKKMIIPAMEKAANILGCSCTYYKKKGVVIIEKKKRWQLM